MTVKRAMKFMFGSAESLMRNISTSIKDVLIATGCSGANYEGPTIRMDMEHIKKYRKLREALKR